MQNEVKSEYRGRLEIERVISRVFRLQALPMSVQRVTQVLNSNTATAEDAGREIARDVSLSAQVLKLVNSGFYGFTTPVTSLSHATVLLGFNVMRTLVMAASAGNIMSGSIGGLWQHSLACARVCALLTRRLGGDEPEELSAIGLLHDIGKVVYAEYFKPEFSAMQEIVQKEDILLAEAEVRVTGMDHAMVAELLLRRWKLPEATVMPIARHHSFNPDDQYASRTAIVHLADILTRAGGFGSGGDRRIPAVQSAAMRQLDVSPADLASLAEEMMVELLEFS